MSADNGVYVGVFKDEQGNLTYRVTHAQAIENCDHSEDFPAELTHASRVSYFGNSEVFTDLTRALEKADEIYQEVADEGFPIEYGICVCEYNEPFPNMTVQEAAEFEEKFWKDFFAKRRKEVGLE
jgi:hypothetical protein